MERLQKIIAQAGIASRRKAEELILQGKVKVNGVVVDQLGFKAKGNDEIEVNGQVIKKEDKVYFVMNKPKNVLSAVVDHSGRDTCVQFIDTKFRIFPVGRLDFDTTGLLILTNDGQFANELMHPRFQIAKTYEVTIDKVLSIEEIKQLEKGIMLEDGMTLPCKVLVNHRNVEKHQMQLDVTIKEGRNHQVKRMMAYFQANVKRLHRKQLGFLTIKDLKPKEYRKLKPFEVVSLRSLANKGIKPKK